MRGLRATDRGCSSHVEPSHPPTTFTGFFREDRHSQSDRQDEKRRKCVLASAEYFTQRLSAPVAPVRGGWGACVTCQPLCCWKVLRGFRTGDQGCCGRFSSSPWTLRNLHDVAVSSYEQFCILVPRFLHSVSPKLFPQFRISS